MASMNIYHYTSLDAATKILQKGNICFWGTRYDSMNDPTDSIYAREIVIPSFKKAVEESELSDYEKDDSEAFPYIVSFSKNEDDFYMWRTYKADVALEFNCDIIREYVDNDKGASFIYFEDCKYPNDNDEMHHAFIETLNTINKGQGTMLSARHAIAFIKRKEFEEEHEVRLVTFDHEGTSSNEKGEFIDHEIPQNIGVKMVRNKDLVLYKEFRLPQEALTGIIINTNNDEHYEKLKSHIKLYLLQQGYKDNVEIRKTNTGNLINF